MSLVAGAALASYDREAVQATLRALHQHQAELSALAEERLERDAVVELANTLERDHAVLDAWLVETDVDTPAADSHPPLGDRDAYVALQEREGDAFETAYLAYQENLLRAAIDYLERQRPEAVEELTEFDNHLRVTRESLRKNLALVESLR
ncbi:DUF4142 domain-containing protein [Halomonas cerina]|uniref:DUF4142 domain-containing protein n=1 Tax=Halomonas cerina TaxID=447424 RepID=A0A839VFV7_9GAMM|nr:DUF4142 domain-containing protein [Halomonas cerina]MBB3192229.1 hypothetical protein [Halomonas cerina]